MKSAQRSRGITLLELMITLAIVGILAAVAYPSYREQIAKSHRAEAAAALWSSAQALERYFSTNGRYTTSATSKTLPTVIQARVPENGGSYYTIAAAGEPGPNSYTLKATRAGVMAGDACGDLTLDQAGAMGLVDKPAGSSKTLADCWRR